MSKSLRIALIIPTKGRQEKLNLLLDSLVRQTRKPDLIIVLDSGTKLLENRKKFDALAVDYIHTEPNSLTQARNIGIRRVPADYDLIGFLDDDVILYPDSLEKILTFWQDSYSRGIAGVAFNVVNQIKMRRFWFLKRIFFLGDSRPGNVLVSGFSTALENINKDVWTKWLPGGATTWRADIFKEFMFDESFKGYGYMEDVDFSYRVGRKYKLMSLAGARLFHRPHPIKTDESFRLGYCEIVNRFYFIGKFQEFSNLLFYWAALGRILENLVYAISGINYYYFQKALGNLKGLASLFLTDCNLFKCEK